MTTRRSTPIRLSIAVLIATSLFHSQSSSAQVRPHPEDRPRIALAFSVGGSRGWAFVGVIKALEDAGIDVDIVTGVSMGCVVGSLYATGRYSAAALEEIALSRDWAALMLDGIQRRNADMIARITTMAWVSVRAERGRPAVSGISRGDRFSFELTKYLWNELRISNMRDLPRALSCLAVDVEEPQAERAVVVLDSGSIVLNARASAALPIVFDPVWIDGRLLADGGLIRAIAVTEAYQMGADVVIAVDLSQNLTPGHGCASPLCPIVRTTKQQRYSDRDAQRDAASIVIEPDASDIAITDFSRVAETIRIGYEATLAKLDAIQAIVDAAGPSVIVETNASGPSLPEPPQTPASTRRAYTDGSPIGVTDCRIEWGGPGATIDDGRARFRSLRREIERAFGCPVAVVGQKDLLRALATLRSTDHFNHISARFELNDSGNALVVYATPHPGSVIGASAGRGMWGPWVSLALTVRNAERQRFVRTSLSKREYYRVRMDYVRALARNVHLWQMIDFTGVPRSIAPGYYLPPGYGFARTRLAFVATDNERHVASVGLFAAKEISGLRSDGPVDVTADVLLILDSIDQTAFATRGTHFWYRYRRSLLNAWWSHTFDLRGYIPVGKRVSVLFGLAGQYVAVDRSQVTRQERANPTDNLLPTLTLAYVEPLGGANIRPLSFGQFVGIGRGEVATSFMQTAMIGAQAQVSAKWTALARFNAATISDALDGSLTSDRVVVGGGVTAIRRTMFGPVSATVGASNFNGLRLMFDFAIGFSL